VHRCAEGASIATDTSWSTEFITATHEKIPNRTLSSVLHRNLLEIGPPVFGDREHELARNWQGALGAPAVGLPQGVEEFRGGASGVTDNSEFSWFAPFAMAWIAAGPTGIGWHNWQVTACSGGSIGKKAMDVAAKVLAASSVDLLTQPKVLEEAKKELATLLAGRVYRQLIPGDSQPPIEINRKTMERYRPLMEGRYQEVDD
jgi:aminobenzoyl-glutamate utilization protein B